MSNLEALRDYLTALPGMAGMTLLELGELPDALCLQALGSDPLVRVYLDGSSLRRELYAILVRRGYGHDETCRAANVETLENLALTLEENTRAGILPALGDGKRVWSLRATDCPIPLVMGEDGLLVDRLDLTLTYFMEGSHASE